MNWLIDRLVKMRLFPGDLDLHLVRASMVIIYFFFGYQKWFDYEAQALIPFFTHGTPHLLDVSGLWHESFHVLPGRFGVAVWSASAAGWLLEQKAWNLGCARIGVHIPLHCHNHPVHAGWLGALGGRISSDRSTVPRVFMHWKRLRTSS